MTDDWKQWAELLNQISDDSRHEKTVYEILRPVLEERVEEKKRRKRRNERKDSNWINVTGEIDLEVFRSLLQLQEQVSRIDERLEDLERRVERLENQRPEELVENYAVSELIDEIRGNEKLVDEIANEVGHRILSESDSDR
jgi:predicted nuclease with TOPRIM domain